MLWLEGIGSSCQKFFPPSSPGVWREILPHLFTTTSLYKTILHPELGIRLRSPRPLFQNWFSYSLFPLTERRCHFRFMAIANHLASIFFPVRRLLRTTICPVYPILYPSGHKVQTSVGFHPDLDLSLRPWGIDLFYYPLLTVIFWTACQFKHGGVVVILYFSPLSGRSRDIMILYSNYY